MVLVTERLSLGIDEEKKKTEDKRKHQKYFPNKPPRHRSFFTALPYYLSWLHISLPHKARTPYLVSYISPTLSLSLLRLDFTNLPPASLISHLCFSQLTPIMALLFLVMLMLAMTGHSTANWCVCRSDVSDSALQKALDYACGAGADCTPITQNGACYQPNTVRGHCSYAVNSYFQKKGQGQGSCEFSGAATVTGSDPSSGSCAYPASSSSTGGTTGGTSTTPSTNSPPSTTTPSTTTPPSMFSPPSSTTTSPSTTNPSILTPPGGSGGVLGGGIGTGLGPSGVGINSDTSAAASSLERVYRLSLKLTPLWFSGLALLWA